MRLIVLTGQRFGRLTVVSQADRLGRKSAWNCLCDCGTTTIAVASHLRSGHTTSCGCAWLESITDHGLSNSAENGIWRNMKSRCRNPKSTKYHLYGGRGITVCERWNDFANFYADMGPRPSPKHSIDRYPDTNGNYEPGNCRWATSGEQSRNTRRTHWITYNGETMCQADWASRLGMHRNTFAQRVSRLPLEQAMIAPPKRKRRKSL